MFEKDKDGTAVVVSLTETLADSVKGYRDAASQVESAEFRQMFTELADKRSEALSDLKAELSRAGHATDGDGTTMGALHQRWLDLKASLTGHDDKAVINEVERGEDYLKEKFEAALASDALDAGFRGIVERAYGSVREGHDRVSDLKHSLEGATGN
jgi:uncharacterized protein (TIGR02284 family)